MLKLKFLSCSTAAAIAVTVMMDPASSILNTVGEAAANYRGC